MARLCDKSAEIVSRRLEAAEAYLECVLASRAGELAYSEALELAERLEACEEFIPLADVDWERVCAILCPEKFSRGFRRYSAQALGMWTRLCETVLPEEHAAPARRAAACDELPGTWEKVGVMERRAELGLPVFDDRDAVLREDAAFLAPQGANGHKDAKIIDGEAAAKLVVLMRGEGRQVIGADQPAGEGEGWYRMREPMAWHRVECGDRGAVVEALRLEGIHTQQKDGELLAYVRPSEVQKVAGLLGGCGAVLAVRQEEKDETGAPARLSGTWQVPPARVEVVAAPQPKRKKGKDEGGWLPGMEAA